MYLSRVEIDYDNRKFLKELDHLGAYHNWVEQSFPEELETRIRTRKLWRIDKLGNHYYLLIISQDKPDLDKLEKYGVVSSAMTKEYDNFINSVFVGQILRFRAVLNPVISRSTGDEEQKRGRVLPLLSEVDQLNYLRERAEKNGFSLDREKTYLLKSNFEVLKRKNNKKLRIVKAEYQGELTITDLEKFIYALKFGIGKKKAYGFGMITVIPL